jgi:regulatory protein
MSSEQSLRKARDAALRLLAYRPRSEAELRTRLDRRFPSETVERVVRSLKQQSLVDDHEFAMLWAESRNRHKPRSATAIRRELVAKGVAADTAAGAASIVDDDESAIRAGARLAYRMEGADFASFRRKLAAFLHRRGYSGSVTRRTVSRLWEEKSHDAALSPHADTD